MREAKSRLTASEVFFEAIARPSYVNLLRDGQPDCWFGFLVIVIGLLH